MAGKYNRVRDDFVPSDHDHVGWMDFTPDTASCSDCGQTWRMTPRGWKPMNPRMDRWPG